VNLTLREAVHGELERRRVAAGHDPEGRTANAGRWQVAGYQLVSNVDAGLLGDVSYPDAGTSWQPVIRPVPLHLVNRPAPLRPVRTTHRRRAVARARRTRCARRRSATAGGDGPPHPVKHNAPGAEPRSAVSTFTRKATTHGRAYPLVTAHVRT
jgi:hypothetical protein